MNGQTNAFRLTGTEQEEPTALRLVAGHLSADLSGGALRTIRHDGVEVLRAISFLVRDRDWGTYSPGIEDLRVDQRGDGFSLSYRATCIGPNASSLSITVAIEGEADGRLSFSGTATTKTGFETNRCGFCVLHPIVGLAGTPVRVEHVDGAVEDTSLPDLIDPWQPFKDIRAITHQVRANVMAECRMEGDTFEMEDQRNWSDASYKTYVRPLALPWPYVIAPGETVEQRVTLAVTDRRSPRDRALQATIAGPAAVRLTSGHVTTPGPAIGAIVTPEEAAAAEAALGCDLDPGVQALVLHYDPRAGHGRDALAALARVAARHTGETTLEIALPCDRDVAEELSEIAAALASADLSPQTIVVSPAIDRQSTPPGSAWPACPPLEELYAAARSAFPGKALGGGMLSYFTELNRKRVPGAGLDLVTHCTNPIVHAADDQSVMQTLEALPFITRSVRAIYGDMPYRIGPSTIPMRQNPYGSRTMDNPDGQRMAMADRDPRQNGQFAAAYAMAYAIAVAPAGLQQLTLSALTGPFGLIAGEEEPVPAGQRRPLFHAVAMLARLAGAPVTPCRADRPEAIMAMTARIGARRVLVVVNLTPTEQLVDTSALDLEDGARQYRLDAETMIAASGGTLPADALGREPLRLGPYGVLWIEN
jgi:hypothetical protein